MDRLATASQLLSSWTQVHVGLGGRRAAFFIAGMGLSGILHRPQRSPQSASRVDDSDAFAPLSMTGNQRSVHLR